MTSLFDLGALSDPSSAMFEFGRGLASSGGNTTLNFAMGDINNNTTNTTNNIHNQYTAPSIPREDDDSQSNDNAAQRHQELLEKLSSLHDEMDRLSNDVEAIKEILSTRHNLDDA